MVVFTLVLQHIVAGLKDIPVHFQLVFNKFFFSMELIENKRLNKWIYILFEKII
jgi:hypothetical protein